MRWKDKVDDWHPIFCWQPYCIEGTWVWLERIERRRRLGGIVDVFEYRLPAIAIEARSGETGTGSTEGESAGLQGIAERATLDPTGEKA